MPGTRQRAAAALALAVLAGSSLSCVAAEDRAQTHQLLPGVQATVVSTVQSAGDPPGTVVVLVPGGGWQSADPAGLTPLAEHLADAGSLVVTVTYRTAAEQAYFPIPVQDVGCGAAFAAHEAAARGLDDPEIVLLGHSAGAQLAAVAALDPTAATNPDCPYPPVAVDGLVGLAGPYDVAAAAEQARSLFGPGASDPQQWDAGNPIALTSHRPDLPVLLVHGTRDYLVPVWFTVQFARELAASGHAVQATYPDFVDHHEVYSAEVAGPVVAAWLSGARSGSQPG